jgi:hypothetical protein
MNIHLLPTDNPSRLSILNSGKLNFGAEIMSSSNSEPQNIYITNSEEIKEGDWVLLYALYPERIKLLKENPKNFENAKTLNVENLVHQTGHKVIILTTDPQLIADGVQAIDDEFLEWFVENPTCEFVEVEKQMLCTYCGGEHCDNLRCNGYEDKPYYEIIIPQEEPKQETLKVAAEIYSSRNYSNHTYDAFLCGAKHQAEKSYSEEEVSELVYNIIGQYANQVNIMIDGDIIDRLFEQLKKK